MLPYIIRNALLMQSTLPVHYSFSFPPYSPHLMSCEGVIGQAKGWIRENELVWEQCDDLEAMVFEAFMQIPDEDILNYIRHCEYF